MKIHPKLVQFFEENDMYDEAMFKYLERNSIMIDYRDPDQLPFIGCAYVISKKDILQKINIFIPYIYNDITMLISIHELTHAIVAYKKINKKFYKDQFIETMPILLEKIYVMNNPSKELIDYSRELDESRRGHPDYDLSMRVVDEIINSYDYKPSITQKKIKKISKKYKKK